MRWIIALLLCAFLGTTVTADDNPKTIMVYISSTPPPGVTKTEWRNTIFRACEVWHLQPGCSVGVVEDINKSDIAFMTKNLTHRKVYAHCRKPWDYGFPHIPMSGATIIIEVNSEIKSLKHHDLTRTLIHEVGHAIGLAHDPRSIVSSGWPRPLSMTDYDREKAKEYQRHVLRMANDSSINR